MPERDARGSPVLDVAERTVVDGLAEQRDPGLVSQPLAEQQRRVPRDREHGGSRDLRRVVHRRELRRGDAKVDLQFDQ